MKCANSLDLESTRCQTKCGEFMRTTVGEKFQLWHIYALNKKGWEHILKIEYGKSSTLRTSSPCNNFIFHEWLLYTMEIYHHVMYLNGGPTYPAEYTSPLRQLISYTLSLGTPSSKSLLYQQIQTICVWHINNCFYTNLTRHVTLVQLEINLCSSWALATDSTKNY